MSKTGKRMKDASKAVDRGARYPLDEAVSLVKAHAKVKFDESVDIALKLGVDPRKADQMIRGSCALPHGTGKSVRVLVFAKGDKATEATEAGADFVGAEDLVTKIQEEGWLGFDRVVATPDMMGQVGKIGKVLGPRGLMPNPKVGTVTTDVAKAVASIKAGQVEFRVDKAGIVHVPCGRASFEQEKLVENISTIIDTVRRMKPASAKGTYLKDLTVSSTMGPGVHLDSTSYAQ